MHFMLPGRRWMRPFLRVESFAPVPVLLALLLFGSGCAGALDDPAENVDVRDVVLEYLLSPAFAGKSFNKQILGDVSVHGMNSETGVVYFSLPDSLCSSEGGVAALKRLLVDTKDVEWAEDREGVLYFDNVARGRPNEKFGCMFRTPHGNIRFDTAAVLNFAYPSTEYSLSLLDLVDFIQDRRTYGGSMSFYRSDSKGLNQTLFINHGAFVARPGEPTLTRLVQGLTSDIRDTDPQAREKKIQRLLDFVSREIRYDRREAARSYDIMKRPCETLMSGKSDCSNKATLFASLLEQIGEEYLLVYSPKHINVAVPRGKFSDANGHSFDWNEKRWVMCETTAEGFRIGEDVLVGELGYEQVEYIQRPSEKDVIVDPHSGKQLVHK